MAKEELSARTVSGCTAACWSLFLQIPLWLALMFGIVQAVNPPQWCWIIFWIYVPVAIIGGIFAGLVKVLGDAKV